ncbi:MAG: 30S ribosomal protein S16 [Patescibacteria group bacterium]
MVTIRLARIGKKKQAFFRIIVSEKSKDTKGTYLEILGSLNPHTDPPQVTLKENRIKYWLEHGATTSPRIHNLFVEYKIISKEKIKVWKPKKKQAEEVNKAKTKPVEVKIEEKTKAESNNAKTEATA